MSINYLDLPYIEPDKLFALLSSYTGALFLDSNFFHEHHGRYSFIVYDPLVTYLPNQHTIKSCLKSWEQLIQSNHQEYNPSLPPFTGGIVGYFSYDLSKKLEVIPSFSLGEIPDYWLGLYNKVFAFDHLQQKCYAFATAVAGFNLDVDAELDSMRKLHDATISDTTLSLISMLPNIKLTANFSEDEYIKIVDLAIKSILDGDIFEVNVAQSFTGKLPPKYKVYDLYRRLREINKAPFASYLNLGKLKILSASPERFLQVTGSTIEARPIKGTIKRSLNPVIDRHLANELSVSAKDLAENIMIVDLMRNDLSKICMPESVMVTKLCGVESFTNLHHLVSVITGKLKPELSIFDIIPACFPGGSITGAPKIRAMQLIEELERKRRGVYCGSIGYFGFNGNVDLSIAIRTIVIHNDDISFNVGGAVTLASDPKSEYQETLLKGQKLSEAINDFNY